MAVMAALSVYWAYLGGSMVAEQPKQVVQWSEVPFTQVEIKDGFWAPRQETNRKVSLVHSLEMEERDGIVGNFRLAAAKKTEGYRGLVFSDSDLYKVIESCSYSLAIAPDPILDRKIDELIELIGSAQMPDGYLNTYYQVKEPGRRLTNLRDNHEIYCAGHLFEAAVAHHAATRKTTLLRIAERYADFLCDTFGPGKRVGYCGHPESELALVKLWKATGKRKYFDLAEFMTLNRGSKFFATEHKTPLEKYDGTYWQDDMPIFDHQRVKGHAVRHGYLLSAATDIASETKNPKLLSMLDTVWKNLTERNLYITGGMGSSASNEGFTEDFDLPNASAYQETCASVAVAMWAHRMNLLYGESSYADVMETALYNGVLAGVSFDGKRFFYVNPLASEGRHHRSDWFGCACCPPNVTRTLGALGNYAYARTPDGIAANLFIQGSVRTTYAGEPLEFDVKTEYPWDGRVMYTFHKVPSKRFVFRFRVPSWSKGASYSLNHSRGLQFQVSGYGAVDRKFEQGDTLDVFLPMEARRVVANPRVAENLGKAAVARGPIVYCLEGADHQVDLDEVSLPLDSDLRLVSSNSDLLGATTLTATGTLTWGTWTGGLYSEAPKSSDVQLRFVPYAFWDNRKPGQMRVWLPTSPPHARVRGLEASASLRLSNITDLCSPEAIRDGREPKSSNAHPGDLCHFWPRKGTKDDFVQFDWKSPQSVSRTRVYWFDDTGVGECRLPSSWKLESLGPTGWTAVTLKRGEQFGVGLDRWFEVEFETVSTKSLRLRFEMKPGFSVGIHEWQVFAE